MANVIIQIDPSTGRPPGTQLPTMTYIAAATVGTNPTIFGPAFDGSGTTKQYMNYVFRASNYASGNLTVDIDHICTGSATTGTVKWECAIAVVAAGAATALTTKSFATATSTTTTVNSTSKGTSRSTVTVSNLDSLAIDNIVTLQIDRDPANDTCTDNALIYWITVSYLST